MLASGAQMLRTSSWQLSRGCLRHPVLRCSKPFASTWITPHRLTRCATSAAPEAGLTDAGDTHMPTVATGMVMSAEAQYFRVALHSTADDASTSTSTPAAHQPGQPQQQLLCVARSLLKKMQRRVLVGDQVKVSAIDWKELRGVVDDIMPRTSELKDPAIANVDHVVLCFSLVNPPFEEQMVTRFLVSVEATDLPITLVLNKADLLSSAEVEAIVQQCRGWGYEALPISCATGEGVGRVAEELQGRTSVVAGPSGAGKSSLINMLRFGRHKAEAASVDSQLPSSCTSAIPTSTSHEEPTSSSSNHHHHHHDTSPSPGGHHTAPSLASTATSHSSTADTAMSSAEDLNHGGATTSSQQQQQNDEQMEAGTRVGHQQQQHGPLGDGVREDLPKRNGDSTSSGTSTCSCSGSSSGDSSSSGYSSRWAEDDRPPSSTATCTSTSPTPSTSTSSTPPGNIRWLTSEDRLLTVGDVSKIGRGKHTTRVVTLLPLPGGGLLADTPGFNQPSLERVVSRQLHWCFPEFRQRINAEGGGCRYADCWHLVEPGCCINEAGLPRWEMYVKLLSEIQVREEYDQQALQAGKKQREGMLKQRAAAGGRTRFEVRLEPKKHRRTSRHMEQQRLREEIEADEEW